MKVVILSLENTLVCFGARMIAAALRQHGDDVSILFAPKEFDQPDSDDEIDRIARWIGEQAPDLIAVSLMTSHMNRIKPIHMAIREVVRAPVIWGGIHPTLCPEECIEYADYVCVGEGERLMIDLVEALSGGGDPSRIPGLWLRRGREIVTNPARARCDDLGDLPFADHDDRTHAILFGGVIQPISPAIWRSFIPGFMDTHYVMSTRGCPHNCTYCCNSALRTVAEGPYLRRRPPGHFVAEMEALKARFPDIKAFVFMDDSFFYGDRAWFEAFCGLYKSRIDLPFFCWANPVGVTEERIELLADAGLVGVHVGLESGSVRISEDVYHRNVPIDRFYRCMDILHRYRSKIVDIRVDVITDNPYETEEDVAETIRVLSRLKKPFFVGIVSLIFYPRTELEKRAIADGLIAHADPDLYRREFFCYRPTYLNRVMRSIPMTPGWLVRFFADYRHVAPVRGLFYAYYFGYFVGVRRRLRALRRIVQLGIYNRFGSKLDPRSVVVNRVALIDF